MKIRLVSFPVCIVILLFFCSPALATPEEFDQLLSRMTDPENPVAYTLATLDLGST